MLVADVALHVVFRSRFTNIAENFVAVGDRSRISPWFESITHGVHIAVGADTRVPEKIPRTAAGLARFQDNEALIRAFTA